MGLMLQPLVKYAVFSGRAGRAEYWLFFLFTLFVSIAIGVVEGVTGLTLEGSELGIISLIFSLAIFLPSLAVGVRRLHDTDRSGWWLLLTFVPILGWIALLIFYCLGGTEGPNRFGEKPSSDA